MFFKYTCSRWYENQSATFPYGRALTPVIDAHLLWMVTSMQHSLVCIHNQKRMTGRTSYVNAYTRLRERSSLVSSQNSRVVGGTRMIFGANQLLIEIKL